MSPYKRILLVPFVVPETWNLKIVTNSVQKGRQDIPYAEQFPARCPTHQSYARNMAKNNYLAVWNN